MARRHLESRAIASVFTIAVLTTAAGPPSQARSSTPVEVGQLKGAPYRVDVPPNWNGGLVLYCHGYRGAPDSFDVNAQDEMAQTFAPLGYAVAQSGYSAGGYALREATVDTERL